jgi:Spy/CpxP family protein refolding chaperone
MLSLAAFARQETVPPLDPGNGHGNGLTTAQIVSIEVKFLTALLGLTQAQQDQATVLFTAAETAKAKFAADIPTQEAAVTAAILANSSAGITKATNALGADTAGIAAADANAQAAFYQLLTADQKTKYAALLTGEFGAGHGGPVGTHGHSN